MKKTLFMVLVAVFVLSFAYIANAIHETEPSGSMAIGPSADAAKLYVYLTKSAPYREKFKLWPGKGKLYSGMGPHGPFLTTYVNGAALHSIKSMGEMADGSIIVNEEYTANKKLQALTVMYKTKGFNPETNDWFCAKYDALNGYVQEAGKSASCITCHGPKKEN
jgi:hypothetical protein